MWEFIQVFSYTITQIHSNHKPFKQQRGRDTPHSIALHFMVPHRHCIFYTLQKDCDRLCCNARFIAVVWKETCSISEACPWGEWEVKISYTLSPTYRPLCPPYQRSHACYQKHSKLTFRCANFQTFFLHRCMYTTYFCLEDFLSLYNLFYNLLFHIICLGNLSLSEFMWC